MDQEIKIDFFKSNTDGNHKLLGTSFTTVQDIQNGSKNLKFKNHNASIVKFDLVQSANFLEYVFGGCQINLNIAIDFTLSNGDPKDFDSLHCKDPRKNEYI